MKYLIIVISFLFCVNIYSQNEPPQISNLQATLNGNQIIITYDLLDNENDAVEITLKAGEIDGILMDLETSNATGDIGLNILSGPGKTITWDWSMNINSGPNFRIMLVADDLQTVNIQEIVDQVDSLNVYNYLSSIVGVRHRIANLTHLTEVQDILISTFENHKLDTEIQTFDHGTYEAKNIIGRMIGTDEESDFYIVDGHYDSVENSPGADDNGSAVAGVLEALRVLSKYSFRKSIKFIGFDLEETGLTGSTHYVQNTLNASENLEGVLNFELIGYYSDAPNSQTLPTGFNLLFPNVVTQLTADDYRGNFITVVADSASTFLSAAYQDAIDNYVPELNSVILDIPVSPSLVPDLLRSDHASFWSVNEPAIMLTDGANFRNPYYHTPGDSIGTLNFSFMTNVIKATVGTLAELAEIRHATTSWINTDFSTDINHHDFCNLQIKSNPVSNKISIQFEDCDHGELILQIYDMAGNTVLTKTIKLEFSKVLPLDVSNFIRGAYFISLKKDEKKMVKKIIIN